VIVHCGVYVGAQVVVLPKFELPKFCQLVQDYKITVAHVVPPIALALAKHPIVSNYNLSSLTKTMSGAAPLTKDLVDAVYSRLKIGIKQGYGLSETSPVTHMQTWDDWSKKIGSVGKLVPNMTAKYIGPDEKEVSIGETGELWVKGPNVFQGYLNNDEATKGCVTEDGYFKTGDVGFQDPDGHFYITDRVKELIKYKGFQVPPAELEGILLGNPKIADACVIGINDPAQATELPRAYIVPAPGNEPTPEFAAEIADWLSTKVANHKKLRGGVRFVKEIPKSQAGKILRRLLKEQAKAEENKAKL
jgi:4-coumarate--CoA ligase